MALVTKGLTRDHARAAGRALRSIINAGDLADAQVTLSLMLTYICKMNELQYDVIESGLRHNAEVLNNNPEIMLEMAEHIQSEIRASRVIVPGVSLPH